jgi:glycosyltransferase involved in cell wall biosynthesis
MSGDPRFSILFVAYPLLAISEESAGGAEQMLLTVEREMLRRGNRTTVAACDGSTVAGRLLSTGKPAGAPDAFEIRECEHSQRILSYLREHSGEFDLIHDESGSFFRHARECPVPVLATLHLPRDFYREEWFHDLPSNLFFNCVSQSQARTFNGLSNLIGIVQNGIDVERFPFAREKREYLLWIGRICEEKAPHLAIAVARQAGLPLIIAGQVYPLSYHHQYFAREIQPALGKDVEFIDSPSFNRKLELLQHTRSLLLTSTAEETSSLVAMEAMACGTPVIAMRRGAFSEIVAHGETGFIVGSVEEMVAAVSRSDKIDPAACRRRVERYFAADRMARDYEALYRHIIASQREQVAA